MKAIQTFPIDGCHSSHLVYARPLTPEHEVVADPIHVRIAIHACGHGELQGRHTPQHRNVAAHYAAHAEDGPAEEQTALHQELPAEEEDVSPHGEMVNQRRGDVHVPEDTAGEQDWGEGKAEA